MFKIDGNRTIHITRGDVGTITVNFNTILSDDNEIVFKICPANDVEHPIYISPPYTPATGDTAVTFTLESDVTKESVPAANTPLTYWYEIVFNPGSYTTTVAGYDVLGPKLFIVYPEGIIS